ncbi:putative lysosomal beta glucosidase [Phytophthora cinnamomi]|uniref:putative lysosomal beta glucosidase n=1 Tax=Phytophthora cinnamomi TaxID=4785 RepID=UPI003559F068|nr:putative lysosomal beta glucosidase [Phytophthora cinnamomi]
MATSLQEDDEGVFEAALSFVDEFEFESGDAMSSLSVLSPQRRQEVPPTLSIGLAMDDAAQPLSREEKRRRRAEKKRLLRQAGVYSDPNRARNEQTREIAFLREQMEKLQLDLQVLQARQTQKGGVRALARVTTRKQRPSVWQEQAVRQRRRREQAECDNVRLRLAVERQKKVADSLGVLIRKRTRQLNNECASLINQCCVSHPAIAVLDFCGDVEEFRGLFYLLDEAYRGMDAVFGANGLATTSIPMGDVHMREGVDGKYLEFSTYKDLPFGLQDTAQASWEYFKGAEKHMAYGHLYEKMAKSLDEPYTVIEEFTKEVYSNSSRADVKMRQVVRRYVEEDRDVVIRVSHAAPIEVKNKMLRGLTHNVRGFAVAKRSPASTPKQELTQLQLCTQIALELNDGYDPQNVRALTNFLIAHGLKNTVVNCEYIENALADNALSR